VTAAIHDFVAKEVLREKEELEVENTHANEEAAAAALAKKDKDAERLRLHKLRRIYSPSEAAVIEGNLERINNGQLPTTIIHALFPNNAASRAWRHFVRTVCGAGQFVESCKWRKRRRDVGGVGGLRVRPTPAGR
jgi:hypothetical protein